MTQMQVREGYAWHLMFYLLVDFGHLCPMLLMSRRPLILPRACMQTQDWPSPASTLLTMMTCRPLPRLMLETHHLARRCCLQTPCSMLRRSAGADGRCCPAWAMIWQASLLISIADAPLHGLAGSARHAGACMASCDGTAVYAQDPSSQVAREAQNAFGALVDVLRAQQELQQRQDAATGSAQHQAAAADLLSRTVEALLGLGALLISCRHQYCCARRSRLVSCQSQIARSHFVPCID